MHIKVIVLNSVLRDARVLKQADSLAKAGHDVTVIGVKDAASSDNSHVLPSGARIELCAPLNSRRVRRWILCALLAAGLVACAAIWALVAAIYPPLRDHMATWLAAGILTMVGLVAAAILAAWLYHLKAPPPRVSFATTLKRGLMAIFKPVLNRLYIQILHSRIYNVVKLSPTDVIHCHDLLPLPVAVRLKTKTNAILIWDAHEIYEEMAQKNRAYAKFCRELITRHQHAVDRFITINDSIAAFYHKHYPGLPKALIVKNAARYTPRHKYDGRLHQAAGLPQSQKIALYQGGFGDKRGLHAIVEAAGYLSDDWTLVMMGWGPLERELKARSNTLNVAVSRSLPAVVFLPGAKQDELVYWTGGATVGLIPYENTGLNHLYCTPNKLWEYPAAGVPVLCSPLVEMTKTIRESGIGWLLPESADPPSIASLINSLQTDMLRETVEACHRFIETDNWDTYGARVVSLYESLSRFRPSTPGGQKEEPHML